MYFDHRATDLKDPQSVQQMARLAQSWSQIQAMDFASDIKALRVGETYSFNAETLAAILSSS